MLFAQMLLIKQDTSSYAADQIKDSIFSQFYFIFIFKLFFLCAPFGDLYFLSFQLLNEPGLGAGIDPGMALTPLPSTIGWY